MTAPKRTEKQSKQDCVSAHVQTQPKHTMFVSFPCSHTHTQVAEAIERVLDECEVRQEGVGFTSTLASPFPSHTTCAHTHTHTRTHNMHTCTHACMPHEPCALVSQVTVASASDQSDQIQALQEEHDAQNQAILRMQQTIKGDTQKRIRTHTHTSPAHTLFSFCNVTLLSCERMPFVSGFLCCFLQTLKPK